MNAERILSLAAALDISDPRIKISRDGVSLYVTVEGFSLGASYAAASASTLDEAGARIEEDLAAKMREKLDKAEREVRGMRQALTGEPSS